MRYFVTIDAVEHAIDVMELPGGGYEVRLLDAPDAPAGSGRKLSAEVVGKGGSLTIRVGERVIDLVVDGEPPEQTVFGSGRRAAVRVESERQRALASVRSSSGAAGQGTVLSPMPGKVIKVLVAEGDDVDAGAPLVVVEAMKMENELAAPKSGVVSKVLVQPGDTVEGGAPLIEVS